jgi:type III restriction enzyme
LLCEQVIGRGLRRVSYDTGEGGLFEAEYVILETKGIDSQQNKTKREFLNEWVKAVNNHGGFGKWHSNVSFHPSDMEQILKKCLK